MTQPGVTASTSDNDPVLTFPAMRIIQPSGREVFSFATTAEELLQIVDVPHIGRGENGQLLGYQRPEVAGHIAEIRRYLESENAVLPNTIVVAFDDRVCFKPDTNTIGPAQPGTLQIFGFGKGERRPGFVVDGQQRLAAIASCSHNTFPFFVTAMVAPSVAEQRKQFVLVNRTKPLPAGMIFELLPEIEGHLPQYLRRQQVAAMVTARLNLEPGSSLQYKIKTPTWPTGSIKDNSIRRTVLNSMNDGALVQLNSPHANDTTHHMTEFVSIFWAGVQTTFQEAWSLPPKASRLTHGVGIVALGYVMDYFYTRHHDEPWTQENVAQWLQPLVPHCAWTCGHWRFGPDDERPWNALQNIDRDVRHLSNFFHRILERQS